MTKKELILLMVEVREIEKQLNILDYNNVIESKQRQLLFLRLDAIYRLVDLQSKQIKLKVVT